MTDVQISSSSWTQTVRVLTVLAILAAWGVATAVPAMSTPASMKGTFNEYASGPSLGYDDVSGNAKLIRTGDGRTNSNVQLKGLLAQTTYAVHVHAGTCADLASPHYFFAGPVPDGDGPNADEIWPGPVTTNPSGNGSAQTSVGAVAGPTARSVVVHATPTGGARIACADLS